MIRALVKLGSDPRSPSHDKVFNCVYRRNSYIYMYSTCIGTCTLMHATSDIICSYVYVGWETAYSLCMFSWTSCSGSNSNWGVQSWSNNYRQSMYVNICTYVYSGRNKDQKLISRFLKIGLFVNYLLPSHWKYTVCLANQNIFGLSYVEIGWKMANGWLLFLALCIHVHICCMYMSTTGTHILKYYICVMTVEWRPTYSLCSSHE